MLPFCCNSVFDFIFRQTLRLDLRDGRLMIGVTRVLINPQVKIIPMQSHVLSSFERTTYVVLTIDFRTAVSDDDDHDDNWDTRGITNRIFPSLIPPRVSRNFRPRRRNYRIVRTVAMARRETNLSHRSFVSILTAPLSRFSNPFSTRLRSNR